MSNVSSSQHHWTLTEMCHCGSVTAEIGHPSVREVDMGPLLPGQCCCEQLKYSKSYTQRDLFPLSPFPLLSSFPLLPAWPNLAVLSTELCSLAPVLRISWHKTQYVFPETPPLSRLPATPHHSHLHTYSALDWAERAHGHTVGVDL